MGLLNGPNAPGHVGNWRFVAAQPQPDASQLFDFRERSQVMAQPHVIGDAFQGLVGSGFGEDVIGREQHVIHLQTDLAGAVARDVVNPDAADGGRPFFQAKLHRHRAVIIFREEVNLHQFIPVIIGNAGPFQENIQPSGGKNHPFFMIGKNAPVEDVDADGGLAELAHVRQAAKMVYVAVGDEDVGEICQLDGRINRGQGVESGLEIVVGLFPARTGIYQDEVLIILNHVNVVDEAGEGLDREAVNFASCVGGKGLDFVHGGIIASLRPGR